MPPPGGARAISGAATLATSIFLGAVLGLFSPSLPPSKVVLVEPTVFEVDSQKPSFQVFSSEARDVALVFPGPPPRTSRRTDDPLQRLNDSMATIP